MHITEKMAAFEIDKRQPLYRQIAHHVRRSILNGEFPADTKLPSTQELETLWSVNSNTVQVALSMLVKEGLLDRVPRRGTFVRTGNRN